MKKNIFIVILALVLLTALSFVVTQNTPVVAQNTPVTISVNGTVANLSIEDKIKTAKLIVIGEVKTTHPSRWLGAPGKDLQNASPDEIIKARGLFTDSLISINQVLKGDIRDSVARVRAFDGKTKRVHLISDIEPSYVVGKTYLLFLTKDSGGLTEKVDPGYYVAVGAFQGVYEIADSKAISRGDEWALDELIAYIENSLSAETSSPTPVPTSAEPLTETPLPITNTPASTELFTETPLPPVTVSSTP